MAVEWLEEGRSLVWSQMLQLRSPVDELRLVKTSEEDPGQWVKESQKYELFTSKNIGFIDITDIKVRSSYGSLSSEAFNMSYY